MVFATLMLTVLLGYWLQFSLYHPFRLWFIYLTNWTLLVQCAYLSLAVYATWRATSPSHRAQDSAAPPARLLRALLALQAVAAPGAALVTILFWCLVYPTWPESAQYAVNYLVHGANLVIALADVAASSQPFLLCYGALLMPYGVLYLTFTLIYYAAGGMNEWGQPWVYRPIYWGAGDAWKGALLSLGLLTLFIPALTLTFWAGVHVRDGAAAARAARGGVLGDEEGDDDVGLMQEGAVPLLRAAAPAGEGEVEEAREGLLEAGAATELRETQAQALLLDARAAGGRASQES